MQHLLFEPQLSKDHLQRHLQRHFQHFNEDDKFDKIETDIK